MEGLKANNVILRISGSGYVEVNVLDNFGGKVSGSGNILYRGSPNIHFNGVDGANLQALDYQ